MRALLNIIEIILVGFAWFFIITLNFKFALIFGIAPFVVSFIKNRITKL
ncbi:AI-2E family transporter [Pectobacterium phage POP12]|nr:AI-2E family transporter [Pectobacterium phage POP12]